MHSNLRWLILVQLLLSEQALCRASPPPSQGSSGTGIRGDGGTLKQKQPTPPVSQPQLGAPEKAAPVEEQDMASSARHMITILSEKLKEHMGDRIHLLGNASCEALLSATTLDDGSSSLFPQELLGLSLVPVLVMAGCQQEAQALVIRLYGLLGQDDAEELLLEVEGLMERRRSQPTATAAPASTSEKIQAETHLSGVMFNIQQLSRQQGAICDGWTRVNGALLLGEAIEGTTGGLEKALSACEHLGFHCAGVSHAGLFKPGQYQAVSRQGSRIVPTESSESESWIRQCNVEEEVSLPGALGKRVRRNLRRNCSNKEEEKVYNVVEWIPAVSTLYNLGTAVYYASMNCSETAKERAILSAVDLGTDALMAVTGGAAGVAGYALGAGVKTGVKAGIKYLLGSMKQEDDLLVNQYSWEDGVISIH